MSRFAVAAPLLPGQVRRDIISRHNSSAAAERAAIRQAKWEKRVGCKETSEAVCIDNDGDICGTVAECREAGTLAN